MNKESAAQVKISLFPKELESATKSKVFGRAFLCMKNWLLYFLDDFSWG
jgi:hypothetical protein